MNFEEPRYRVQTAVIIVVVIIEILWLVYATKHFGKAGEHRSSSIWSGCISIGIIGFFVMMICSALTEIR